MSSHDNARRGEKKRTEHGSDWEGPDGSPPHVARSRAKWKKIKHRTQRRTGRVTYKYHAFKPGKLSPLPEE